jgi:ADP-heptose:LPS heptosyltransferase
MKRLRLLLLRLLAFLARPFARGAAVQPANILYIKPDHLGDLLLATPVLAALRARFPAARITALVGPWAQIVLQRNPDVDIVLTCSFPGFTRRPPLRPFARPYLMLLRYGLLLRATPYDLAIIGRDDHWWGAALALLAGIPTRVGFDVAECRPFLTTALPWNPHAHVTEQGLALVAAAPSDERRSGPYLSPPAPIALSERPAIRAFPTRFDPSPDDITWANDWLRSHGVDAGQRLVVIHPGTGGPSKLWFAERWAAVADMLAADGVRLVVTGGPGEEALVAEVAAGARERPSALAGQTTVGQLAALLRRATLVMGVDSGPLHLAAAQGVPTIHLYGPGDSGRFGPWGDSARHVVIRADLWCSPCGVFKACPRGLARPECMERIGVALVVAEARRLLDAAS